MTNEKYLEQKSNIHIYCEILLGFLQYTEVKEELTQENYNKLLCKKMKFQNPYDLKQFRSCIDLLEDTQDAINEVQESGLTTKFNSNGEMYLRLYGVLNACWLQTEAIIDLARLFNLKTQDEIKNKLKSFKIIEIRNKIASHSTNYIMRNKEKNENDFFRLTQSSINKWGNKLHIVSSKSVSEEINLIDIMKDFTHQIERILNEIVQKELDVRIFKREPLEWLLERFNFIQERQLITVKQ